MGITLVYHVRGKFVRSGQHVVYDGEDIEGIDPDELNSMDLEHYIMKTIIGGFQLFYEGHGEREVPGFKLLSSDDSIRDMLDLYKDREVYDLYVKHDMSYSETLGGVEDEGAVVVTEEAPTSLGDPVSSGKQQDLIETSEEIDLADSSDEDLGEQDKPRASEEILFDGFEFGSDADDDEVQELRKKVEKVEERVRKGITPITYAHSLYYSDSDPDPGYDRVGDEGETEGFDSDDIGSYDDTDVDDEIADHGVRRKSRFVRYNKDTDKPYFELGMVFTDIYEVRVEVNKYSIKE
ncbi:unnamed protein product [Linum trigynum]|uniref:PB1-like domain-containing protein n=1 Tax=Linum trigynum TaxID=586398 RepID=A0AAV2D8I4_9ROSI